MIIRSPSLQQMTSEFNFKSLFELAFWKSKLSLLSKHFSAPEGLKRHGQSVFSVSQSSATATRSGLFVSHFTFPLFTAFGLVTSRNVRKLSKSAYFRAKILEKYVYISRLTRSFLYTGTWLFSFHLHNREKDICESTDVRIVYKRKIYARQDEKRYPWLLMWLSCLGDSQDSNIPFVNS